MGVYRILAGSEHPQRDISKAVRSKKKLEEISRNFGGLDPAKTLSRVRRAGCLFGFGVCIDYQPDKTYAVLYKQDCPLSPNAARTEEIHLTLHKNLNASRLTEHPPARGGEMLKRSHFSCILA